MFGGKKKTAKEMSREWTRNLNREMRQMDRQIRKAQQTKKKLQNELKKEARNCSGDRQRMGALKIMAKSIVQQDKQIAQMYGSKAAMNSVVLQIKEQQASMKMAKAMKTSAKISSMMGNLIRVPELQASMQQMQQQMMKAGLVQEIIDETMDDVMGVSDDEVDEEIDKVVMEITNMNMSDIAAINGNLPVNHNTNVNQEEQKDEPEMLDMKSRLQALQ